MDKYGECRLRIAHVALSALPSTVGGLEIVVDQLVRHQRLLGHEAWLVTRWQQARAARASQKDYPVLALPPFRSMKRTPYTLGLPRWPAELALGFHQLRQRFDVVHAHWLFPTAWLVSRPSALLGVPLVATAHGADLQSEPGSGYGYRQFPENERRLHDVAARLDAAIAISRNMESRLSEVGVAESRIHAIPNGVDFNRFDQAASTRQATRAELAVGPKTRLLLSVGRNQPSKGLAVIPNVLKLLRSSGHDVLWCVVGAGVGELRDAFEVAGVAEYSRLLDPADSPSRSGFFPSPELIAIYGAADLFAFPSLTEGAPLVLLEAMAAGLPVVGNDVQGVRDAITENVNGLLARPNDPQSMASRIAQIIDNPELERALRAAGRKKARAHDWRTIAERHCDIYRSVVRRTS